MATRILGSFVGPGATVKHLGPRPDADVEGGLTLCGLFLQPMASVAVGEGRFVHADRARRIGHAG